MDEEQREGVRAYAADMPEMEWHAIDVAEKLRVAVEGSLVRAPVILRPPVLAELADVPDAGSVVPTRSGNRTPASACLPGGNEGRRELLQGRRYETGVAA